ncbi:hypothetical protein HK098_001197 [Nowakowskiella sp. JEL0407]|nr:hypothetical protein HK098_001197 [Nowakowskiella sp. JEL0407]
MTAPRPHVLPQLSAFPGLRKRSSSSPQFSASLLSTYNSTAPSKSFSSVENYANLSSSSSAVSSTQSRPQSFIHVTEVPSSNSNGVTSGAYSTMDQYVRVKVRKGRFIVSSWEHRGKIPVSHIESLSQMESSLNSKVHEAQDHAG